MRFLLLFLVLTNCALAQTTPTVGISFTLPSVSLLDIAPNNTGFTLSYSAPTEAGNQITTTATNNTKWINFTSAVPPTTTRKVTASISGTMPGGIDLLLAIASVAGTGAGVRGTSAGSITLSTTPQAIINGIGGAYTSDGSGNGYQLTFSLGVSSYANLRNQSSTVSIIYTLVDN